MTVPSAAVSVTERAAAGRAGGPDRRAALVIGVLFLVGDAAGVLSVLVQGNLLAQPVDLARVGAAQDRLALSALLVLVMGLSLAMVPVVALPVLRRYHEVLALAYLVLRGAVETVCYLAVAGLTLAVGRLGHEYLTTAPGAADALRSVGRVVAEAPDKVVDPVLQIVFSLGALAFSWVLFVSRLVPRWLAGWGLLGALLYLASGLSALFGATVGGLMIVLAVQEVVLALWLIIKGFTVAPGAADST